MRPIAKICTISTTGLIPITYYLLIVISLSNLKSAGKSIRSHMHLRRFLLFHLTDNFSQHRLDSFNSHFNKVDYLP